MQVALRAYNIVDTYAYRYVLTVAVSHSMKSILKLYAEIIHIFTKIVRNFRIQNTVKSMKKWDLASIKRIAI